MTLNPDLVIDDYFVMLIHSNMCVRNEETIYESLHHTHCLQSFCSFPQPTLYENYHRIQFYPADFHNFLMSSEVGFARHQFLGIPENKSKGRALLPPMLRYATPIPQQSWDANNLLYTTDIKQPCKFGLVVTFLYYSANRIRNGLTHWICTHFESN